MLCPSQITGGNGVGVSDGSIVIISRQPFAGWYPRAGARTVLKEGVKGGMYEGPRRGPLLLMVHIESLQIIESTTVALKARDRGNLLAGKRA